MVYQLKRKVSGGVGDENANHLGLNGVIWRRPLSIEEPTTPNAFLKLVVRVLLVSGGCIFITLTVQYKYENMQNL